MHLDHSNIENLKHVIERSHLSKEALLLKNTISSTLYNWSMFDHSLFHLSNFEDISIYKTGKISEEQYIETYFNFGAYRKRIITHKFNKLIQDGASIVLNKMQNKCVFINEICQVFSTYTGCLTNANSYAAKGGVGTFNLHWDTHDVYAVQLIGKKHWKIYPPTFIDPLPNHKSKDCTERPTAPCIDVVLEAGDVLYIPRGWWHDAMPIDNQDTFHIAIGIFPNTILDYMSWLLANKMADHIPVRDYAQGNEQENLQNSLKHFSELALEKNIFLEFCEEHTKHIRYKTGLNTAALFSDSINLEKLTFNGVFKSQFDESYIINGVKFDSGVGFQEICSIIRDPNYKSTSSLDRDIIKNLIAFGIFS